MTGHPLPAWCRALLRTGGRIVPNTQRADWRAEWTAELTAAWQRRGRDAAVKRRLVRRAVLSLFDAVMCRWEERRFRRSRGQPEKPRKTNMLADLVDDIRYGIRSLTRSPAFALVAVLTIALGIGANTTIFSIVDAIVWRPMPYPEPDRVVALWPGRSFSPEEVVRLEDELTSFSSLAAYVDAGAAFAREGGAVYLFGSTVSAQFFDVLGRQASLGRGFLPGEDKFGANDKVLLAHDFWVRDFGADSSAVGQRILLNNRPYTIVGVMPPGLDVLQRNASFVRPLTMSPESPNFTGNWVNVIGRLAPGVTTDQAREEMQTVFESWVERFGYNPTFGTNGNIIPIHEAVTAQARSSMLLLMGAVVLTLLVATSNLANLLLNQALSRQQEIAVRGALGAGPSRILRQLITESTVITAVGGVLGVAFSLWAVPAIVSILPESTPRLERVGIDGRVLSFSFGLVLVTGWLAGMLPGWQMRGPALHVLHSGTRGASETRSRRAIRSGLVITELALSVVLLAGSGVLLRSFQAMNAVETGMEPERLLTFALSPTNEINADGGAGVNQYYDRILDIVSALPEVESAAAIHVLPIGGAGWNSAVRVEGREVLPDAPYVGVWWRPATDNYLETAGMRVLAGRPLARTDTESSPWVAVINESMARQFWPNEDPLGQRFQYGLEGDRFITVIGIVGNVTHLGLTSTTPPTIYRPYAQAAPRLSRMNVNQRWVVARTTVDPEVARESVRHTVAAAIPETPIVNLRPMTAVIQRSLADPRALTTLLGFFATAALLLGATGLYGVVSYTVRQRTRELGIRIALGAKGSDVLLSVLKQGVVYAGIGLPIGLLGAWLGSCAIATSLFNVSPVDPLTYGIVTVVLFAVVIVATLAPATTARRTDPVVSLRAE